MFLNAAVCRSTSSVFDCVSWLLSADHAHVGNPADVMSQSNSSEDVQENMEPRDCPFCQITTRETDTEILLSDDQLVCFRDVKPGAAHHYLIVPRRHIDSCRTLQGDDVPLVEQMEKMGRTILEQNRVSNLDDVRMGFHLPPFSSVPHLHLHALAPASKMDLRSELHYGPHSYWFITVDKVLSQLKTHGRVK